MKNNQETKFIGGIQYILDNGRWVSVYGMDLDPHDPNYLLFTPIKRKSDEDAGDWLHLANVQRQHIRKYGCISLVPSCFLHHIYALPKEGGLL